MRIKTLNFIFSSLIGAVLLLFIGLIIYTQIYFIKQNNKIIIDCPKITCPILEYNDSLKYDDSLVEPEIIYKSYPEYIEKIVIKNVTTTEYVIDEQCQTELKKVKQEFSFWKESFCK